MAKDQFKLEDCGVFIGLTTLPFGKEESFFEKEIKQRIFENYRKRIDDYCFNKSNGDESAQEKEEEFQEYFYIPKAYCLLGRFDLAILALIDDFELSSRDFHPFSFLLYSGDEETDPESFTFQTISGSVPKNRQEKGSNKSGLIQKAKKTFLANQTGHLAFPFFGICTFKLNNGFLIGIGEEYCRLVINAIDEVISGQDNYPEELEYILLYSYGWAEISCLFFSTSFQNIANIILKIREWCLGDLKPYDRDGFIERIKMNSFYGNLAEEKDFSPDQLESQHVFANTLSSFGFDFELFLRMDGEKLNWEKLNRGFKPIPVKDTMGFYTRFFVKPGHLGSVIKANPLEEKLNFQNLVVGRGDLSYYSNDSVLELYNLLKKLFVKKESPVFWKHLQKIYTIPEVVINFNLPVVGEDHFFYSEKSKRFCFSSTEMKEIAKNLLKCRVSKTIREKVLNMYVNYNEGMQEPVLYGFFIELHPFLMRVRDDLKEFAKDSNPPRPVKETGEILEGLADIFEYAFKNRFHQSHVMSELSDLNSEYKGGVQQLLSTVDSIYKIVSRINFKSAFVNPAFAYVTSSPSVVSDQFGVRLNYFTVFQPAIFVAIAVHEAANFILEGNQRAEEMRKLRDLTTSLDEDLDWPYEGTGHYLLVDLITFFIGFNQDVELFHFWHFHYVLQLSDLYNSDGSIEKEIFCKFLLRSLLLFEVLKRNGFDHELLNHNEEAPIPVLRDCWSKVYPKCVEKVNLFFDNSREKLIADWSREAMDLIKVMLINDYCCISEGKLNTKKKVLHRYWEVLQKKEVPVYSTSDDLWEVEYEKIEDEIIIEERCKELIELSAKIKSALNRGEMYQSQDRELHSVSFLVHAHILAYLKIIYEECTKGKCLTVLQRDEEGNPKDPKSNASSGYPMTYSNLLFDPIGGMITSGLCSRRKYFELRSAFVLSLWDIGWQYKKRLFFNDGISLSG